MSTILFLSIITAFSSCKGDGQKTAESKPAAIVATNVGDTVLDLGKNIDCVFQDKDGYYWFGSNGDGLFRYDGKTLTHLTEKQGLCSNFVQYIQQDINGFLWFSTRDGICCYNGSVFTNYTSTIENAPPGKVQYTKGGLFFNTKNGLCLYNGSTFTGFAISPITYKPAASEMNRPYSVYASMVDKSGNMWFGTQEKGVCRYDGSSLMFLSDKNLAGPAVRCMMQSRSGDLWFGNNGGGVFRYDGKTLTNFSEENKLDNPEFLKDHRSGDKPGTLARIFSMNEDKDGNLWFGTIDAGLWKYDGTSLVNYTTGDGLPGNSVWAIGKDNKGELWFVTNGDAVCKFNGKTFIKQSFH